MLKQVILGDFVIPISYIESLNIVESIYSPIATGIIVLNDSGFAEKCLKHKDFNINIIFGDNTTDLDYFISFNVHAFDTTEYDTKNNMVNKRLLKFSSHYSIKLLTDDTYLNYQKLSSSQMIKNICNLLNVKTNLLTSTSFKWDFVSPNCNLNESIKYITKRTIDNNSNGGFLFFPDIFSCKVNFLNYYNLLDSVIGMYNYVLLSDTNDDNYIGKIIDIKIVKEFNALREFSKGLNNTNMVGFDVKTGKIINDKTLIDSIIKSNDKIYGYFPVDKNDISSGLNVDIRTLSSEYFIKCEKSQKYNDMLMNQLVLEILLNGDYNRRLGMLTTIATNIYANNNETNTRTIDPKISGTFLISDIEHFWSNNIYQQKIKTIKCGYSKMFSDKGLLKIS